MSWPCVRNGRYGVKTRKVYPPLARARALRKSRSRAIARHQRRSRNLILISSALLISTLLFTWGYCL